MSKKLSWLGIVPLFAFTFGLGCILDFKDYSVEGFLIVYVSLFCIPFLWALPLKDFNSYNTFKATMYGIVSVIVLGVYHLIHFSSGGSRESFLLVVPLIALIELGVSTNIPRDSDYGVNE